MQKEWIAIVGLLITISSLILAQLKANRLAKTVEKRLEYKLKIFEILRGEYRTSADIYSRFQTATTMSVDIITINKAIYEMLVEDMILAHDNGTYTANTMDD